jgi:uncharacterized protein YcnI
MPHKRRTKTLIGLLAGFLSLVFLFGGVARAHVSVQPAQATQGGFTKLTFRVPNERPDASTTGLRVQLPQETPFAFVSVKPTPGWTAQATESTLATPIEVEGETVTQAVSEVSWTGGEIKPGEFQEFEISVGPMPEVSELMFPAIQIYSSGEEVAWIEAPTEDGEEPEYPAPTIELVASSGDGDHHDDDATATPISAADSDEAASGDDHSSSSDALAIAALVVGGIAIVLSLIAIAIGRGKSSSA